MGIAAVVVVNSTVGVGQWLALGGHWDSCSGCSE